MLTSLAQTMSMILETMCISMLEHGSLSHSHTADSVNAFKAKKRSDSCAQTKLA